MHYLPHVYTKIACDSQTSIQKLESLLTLLKLFLPHHLFTYVRLIYRILLNTRAFPIEAPLPPPNF